jgi:hypothetical protein
MSDSKESTDVVELKDLLRETLESYRWVLVAVFVTTAIFWGSVLIKSKISAPKAQGSIRIDLVFEGATDGEYPDGTAFSLSHIMSPVVLQEVFSQLELEEYVSSQDFYSALTVEPFTPERELILEKYQNVLNKRGLTRPEIEELEGQLKQELDISSKGGAEIKFVFLDGDIPLPMVERILDSIPRVWANYVTEKRGVLDVEAPIYSKSTIDYELFNSVDYLISAELLLDKIALLRENVDLIKDLPNGVKVKDPVSGLTVLDLERSIFDIERYRLRPMISPIKSLGIAKDRGSVSLYFQNEILELNRETSLLRSKINNTQIAYREYVRSSSGGSLQGEASENGSSFSPQLSSSFLEQLLEMSDTGKDIEFRQQLKKEQIELSNELAEKEMESKRMNEVIRSMDAGKASVEGELVEFYSVKAAKELPEILSGIEGFFELSERLYEVVSLRNLGSGGQMYQRSDGDLEYTKFDSVVSIANASKFLVYVVVVGCITVLVRLTKRFLIDRRVGSAP